LPPSSTFKAVAAKITEKVAKDQKRKATEPQKNVKEATIHCNQD